MTDYFTLKLIHILSATVLFGTGLGTAFAMWRADASGDIRAIAVVSRNVVLADWLFTTPAVIVQPLTGFWMLHLLGIPMSLTWVWLSLLLYVAIGLCWIPVVFIQLRVARLSAELAAAGQAPDLAYRRLMRAWYALGWPAFLATIGIFGLMVFKPA
ncbi:DUF2269 family protein [Wenzhouxiangella marina]|uniref:Putative integral membrane protein n=1 Tax=Wenzhouxiangella marina TaxID=1579979 RepID=A0A0K0XUF8_9GAMM|nr:DUF2269 domain-containing protein [Wenzhouxiangella marina]AKS41251.1 putative integral membrane protein [Wenzhouxiangella marina]MBB6088131.1 putative membrane protein [Wenzhouxiangella marina]